MAANFFMYFGCWKWIWYKIWHLAILWPFWKNYKKFAFLRISRKILILEKKCSTKNNLEILYKKGPVHNFRNFNRLHIIWLWIMKSFQLDYSLYSDFYNCKCIVVYGFRFSTRLSSSLDNSSEELPHFRFRWNYIKCSFAFL